jgi:uncharacterized protein
MPMKPGPKLLHDAIHRLVPFEDNPTDKLLLRLINTKEFQRLRRIKQLGFSETVFPGANHTRFAHSIGVAHIARAFLDRLDLMLGPGVITNGSREIVLAGALLHDIGHGPFSHAFEKVTDQDHEARTREIVLSDATEVHQVLIEYDSQLPGRVADLWEQDPDSTEAHLPAYLTHIVSSQLDADRFDYLLRDSYSAGVDYGEFDYRWLITHLSVDENNQRLQLGAKALFAAEAYIFARYHMYRTVYFHKTTRAAEVMFKLLLRYFRQMTEHGSASEISAVAPGIPTNFLKAFKQDMALNEYLTLDDHTVTEFCKAASESKDKTLADLAFALLNRRYLKAYDLTGANISSFDEFQARVRELLKQRELPQEWSSQIDSPGDTPYKEYDPDSEEPNTQIYIENAAGVATEISKLSEPVAHLKKYSMFRFYFPEFLREEIFTIGNETIRK